MHPEKIYFRQTRDEKRCLIVGERGRHAMHEGTGRVSG